MTISNKREQALFEVVSDAVIEADADGVITAVNSKALRLFGYSREELLGFPLTMLMPSPYREQHDGYMNRYLHTGEAHVIGIGREVTGKRKDGTLFPLFLMVNEYGEREDRRFIGALQDLSDKIKVRELSAVNLSLEGTLGEKSRTEDQLLLALREKDILLKEVHHRVKNNLQLILSLLSLRMRRRTDTPEQLVEEIRSRIQSIALLHEMLYRSADLSRLEIRDYAKQLVDQLLREFSSARQIKTELSSDSVLVEIDLAIGVGLILTELITNALKYAFRGRERGVLRVTILAQDGSLHLEVADDGPGFPDGFNPENSKSLGVELVRKLAEKYRGGVKFNSSDKGAIVTVNVEIDE